MENSKFIDIKLEQIGFLAWVDKNDFDYVFIFSDKDIDYEKIKNLIVSNYKNFGKEIKVSKYNVYFDTTSQLDKFSCYDFIINDLEHFPVFDLSEKKKLNFIKNHLNQIVTEKYDEKIVTMPKTKFNEYEFLDEQWKELSQNLFDFNGVTYNLNLSTAKEIKKFIDKLLKEGDEK